MVNTSEAITHILQTDGVSVGFDVTPSFEKLHSRYSTEVRAARSAALVALFKEHLLCSPAFRVHHRAAALSHFVGGCDAAHSC